MKPRFSVLIPTHNRERYVCEAIDSVLGQTFADYEVFVIDDGSTDRTPVALRAYGGRINILRQANQGPEIARNLGAAAAKGEYLVMLDSDDLLMPYALQTYDQILRVLDSPPILIGTMTSFEDGEPLPATAQAVGDLEVMTYPDFLSKGVGVWLSNSCIVVRKSLYEEVGGARHSSPTTFHLDDFHLILKLGTYGRCIVVRKPITVAYRIHNSNSIRSLTSMVQGIYSIVRSEHNGEYPGGLRRRFARYACIGGIAWVWVQNAWKLRQYGQSCALLCRSFPMVVAGACKKLRTKYRQQRPLVLLPQYREPPIPRRLEYGGGNTTCPSTSPTGGGD